MLVIKKFFFLNPIDDAKFRKQTRRYDVNRNQLPKCYLHMQVPLAVMR